MVLPNLAVKIAELNLENPIIVASGPLTSDLESIVRIAGYQPGAVVTKTIAIREAAPPSPNIYRLRDGSLLNCEEWSEKSLSYWVKCIQKLRSLELSGVKIIASIVSLSGEVWEIEKILRELSTAKPDAVEVTCLYDPSKLAEHVKAAVSAIDVPVLAKISIPFLNDHYVIEVCERIINSGARAVVVGDTYGPCLHVDIETCKPVLGSKNGSGRISGPAIRPFTIYYTSLLARKGIPVISCGGIERWEDVVEALMSGALAVEVLTALILKGADRIIELKNKVQSYLSKAGYEDIGEIVGKANYEIEQRIKGEVPHGKWKPTIDAALCTKCGLCSKLCPYHAIKVLETPIIDEERCGKCGLCLSICPAKAIR